MSEQPPTPPPPPQPYGYYPSTPPYGVVAVPQQTNPLATAGMVLGICGAIFWGAGLAELALVSLAIIFGAVALGRRRRHLGGRGKAQAALILGIIGAVGYLIVGIVSAGITLLI